MVKVKRMEGMEQEKCAPKISLARDLEGEVGQIKTEIPRKCPPVLQFYRRNSYRIRRLFY